MEFITGPYVKALARGIDAVLDDYRSALLGLEAKAITEPDTPLSYLQYKLDDVSATWHSIAWYGVDIYFAQQCSLAVYNTPYDVLEQAPRGLFTSSV